MLARTNEHMDLCSKSTQAVIDCQGRAIPAMPDLDTQHRISDLADAMSLPVGACIQG
jgi:hypothetical protein